MINYLYSRKNIILSLVIITLAVFPIYAASSLDYETLAVSGTREEISNALSLNKNLSRTVFNDEKETFLMLLLKNDRSYNIIETAVKAGCLSSSSIKTASGRTTLMYACQYESDTKVIEYIIKKGDSSKKNRIKTIKSEDYSKKSAFDYALLNTKNRSIYALLTTYTPDPSAVKRDFQSIFDYNAEEPKYQTTEEKAKQIEDTIKNQIESASNTKIANIIEIPQTDSQDTDTKKQTSPDAVLDTASKTLSEDSKETADEKISSTLQDTPQDSNAQEENIKKITPYSQTFIYDYILSNSDSQEISDTDKEITIEDPNLSDSKGVTLLMKACKSGNDWEVNRLIECGANVNKRDKDGWSALMYAVRYQNNLNIVTRLIEAGAHVRVRNNYNTTPLIMAAQYNQNPDILNLLLKNRNISENEVYNAFILSLSSNIGTDYIKTSKVQLFIDMNIPLNGTWKGMTPLMYACQYNSSTNVIKLLLDNGARTGITDADGKTAFDYAKTNKNLVHDDVYWALNNSN